MDLLKQLKCNCHFPVSFFDQARNSSCPRTTYSYPTLYQSVHYTTQEEIHSATSYHLFYPVRTFLNYYNKACLTIEKFLRNCLTIFTYWWFQAVISFFTMQLQLSSVFFTFSLGTRTHYFGRTILHGGAKVNLPVKFST